MPWTTKTPGRYWASWALTASSGRCSVRPSDPKQLRGRPIPVLAPSHTESSPHAPGNKVEPSSLFQSIDVDASVVPPLQLRTFKSSDTRARADAAMGFWAGGEELPCCMSSFAVSMHCQVFLKRLRVTGNYFVF